MSSKKRAPGTAAVAVLVGVVAMLSSSRVAAQEPAPPDGGANPLAGNGPSSAGMPGGDLVAQILSWGQWLGLAACAAVIIYGAATWHGFAGASAGRSVAGKTYVIAGAAGLLIIGLLPTIVSMLFAAGRS